MRHILKNKNETVNFRSQAGDNKKHEEKKNE